MSATLTNIQTTIVNNSNHTRSLGFVPPHGVTLGPYEQYTFDGNIDRLWTNPNGTHNRRKKLSVETALLNGNLQIVSTPAPVMADVATGATKVDQLKSGTISAVAPSWGSYTIVAGAFTTPTSATTTTVSSATLVFTAAVTGFTSHSQITLTQNGTPVSLSNSNTPTTSDNITYTIPGLVGLTATAGAVYVLTIPHANSGILDAHGNALFADITVTWTHA